MQKVGRFTLVLIVCGLFALLFSGQKALESQVDSSDLLLFQGKKQWDIGQFDTAYILFRKAQISASQAQNLPNHTEATYRAGLYLTRQMRLAEAIPTLDSAIAMGRQLDSLSATVLFARRERAFVSLNQGQIPDAISRYEKMIQDMAPLPPEADSIRGLVKESLGQAYFYQGNFEAGLQKSLEALALYQGVFHSTHVKIGICANTLGIMYMYLNRFPEAIEHFELSEQIFAKHYPPSHPNILQIQTNIGVLYAEMGLFWKSLAAHRKVFKQKDKLEPRPYMNALLNLGATLMAVGDYQNALDHFNEVEIFLKDYPELAVEQMAFIAQNRSAIYQQLGKQEAALQQIEQALEQNKKLRGEDHPELITEYFQWGDLLMSRKQYQTAKAAFEKALQITKKQIGKHSLQGGHALKYLGRLARKEKHFALSTKRFQEAQAHYVAIGNTFEQADTYTELAVTWREAGVEDSCMAMHQKAWEVLFPTQPQDIKTHWALHPLEEMLFEQGESMRTFLTNPETSFKTASLDTGLFHQALYYFEAAIAVVDSQRHYFESPVSQQVRLTDQLPVYEAALDMFYELQGGLRDANGAFQLAEKSKANDLRDHLRGIEALQFAGLPDSLLEQERYYRQRIARLNDARMNPGTDSQKLTDLQQKSYTLKRKYQVFLKRLEQDYPAYYALKFAQKTPSSAEILKTLHPHQAIYSYFWGKKHLYTFRLFQGEISFYQQPIQDVQPALKSWITFTSSPPQDGQSTPDSVFSSAYTLTQYLLPDLSDQIEQITILPDGMLGYLPFESLTRAQVNTSDMRSWPFLGKDIAFNYAPAAELIINQKDSRKLSSQYVGFAPHFEEGNLVASRNQLSPLLHNQDEIIAAAKLLKGNAFTGNKAEESQIKELGKGPYILHFATHALADENDLMRSRLFFKSSLDTVDDGILYAHEIYGLELNSPLCVLSACQTAKGPLQQGEGVMSLARAFQYSGCKRVLSTLWQTDDRAAGRLSQDFFAALSDGLPVEQALLQARRNWLEEADNEYAHPYYWAGFVLIGDGGRIPIRKTAPWGEIFLISSLALMLSLGLFFWRRKRRGV